MRKVAIAAILALMTGTTARGAVLSLRVSGSPDATALNLAVSETAAFEIVLDLEEFEEAGAANIFLDTVQVAPAGDADGEIFEVVSVLRAGDPDFIWTGAREFMVAPMIGLEFEDLPPGAGISLDNAAEHNGYYLVASRAAGDVLAGGTGAPYILDRIVINGITPGTIEVTFEETPRPPEVLQSSTGSTIAFDLGLGDFGRDGPPTVQRDPQPLIVTVTEAGAGDDDAPPSGDGDPEVVDDSTPGDDAVDDTGVADPDDDVEVEPAEGEEDVSDDDPGDEAPPDDDGAGDDVPGDDAPDDPPSDDADEDADTATDEPDDADVPGDEADEPADGGDETPDDAVDAGPATDGEPGDLDPEDGNDSATTTTARPCGFGAIGGLLMSFVGLFAMRPNSRRRRLAD